MKPLVVATRKSALALAQCRAFVAEVRRVTGREVEELHVTTTGDRIQDRALSAIGGKGLFIKEIEEALLDGRADFAVHSMKDVPAELAPGLALACVPRREDARDVLVSRSGAGLRALAPGSRLGTSSLRRAAALGAARPDLAILPLRGNVDTRLRRCADGELDAIVLAHAGLLRLGLAARVTEVLEPELCLPAVGQGALAVETREDDAVTRALLARLGDPVAARAVAAERGVMSAVEGSCQVPVAAHAALVDGGIHLRAMLAQPDGTGAQFQEHRGPWPGTDAAAAEIGRALGVDLRTAVRGGAGALRTPRAP